MNRALPSPALHAILAICLALVPAAAQEGKTGFASLLEEVAKIQAEPAMRSASIGFCVIDTASESPEPVLAYEADRALVPASTLKAVTTATALEVLGADYRFQTELQYTGTLAEDGTLTGNVIIKGGGDPTLAESGADVLFGKWAEAIRAAGIQRVEGSVIGDDSAFGTQLIPDGWQWYDLGNYYAAGASALSFQENQFFCTFRTEIPGKIAPLVGTTPKLPGIQLVNEMRVGTAGSGDQGYIYGHPFGSQFYLRGSVPADAPQFTIKGSMPDPAHFCARSFHDYLNDNGLPVSGAPTTHRLLAIDGKTIEGERTHLATHQSESLAVLVVPTNHRSINLRAECIHRVMGLTRKGLGSTAAGAEVTREFWAGHQIDLAGFSMTDGSGLARSNTITPRQMTLMLHRAAKFPTFQSFYDSLPVAGRSGTMSSLGRGTVIEGKVHAKSGTIERIRNYVGYANAASGKRYAFALFMNHYSSEPAEARSAAVRLLTKLVEQ